MSLRVAFFVFLSISLHVIFIQIPREKIKSSKVEKLKSRNKGM